MDLLRQELRSFTRACEELLFDDLHSRLNQEEQELILYYLNELFEKLGHKP